MIAGVKHPRNSLISRLPLSDQERWLNLLEPVDLAAGQELCASGRVPTHAYLPTTAVVSLAYTTQDGECDEVAVVGHEGMVGVPSFMSGRSTPTAGIVQRAGQALRLHAVTLKEEVERSAAVRQVMLEYGSALTVQVSQTAVCNCHHTVEQRLARRLLQGLDRQRGSDLVITHAELAQLLGVRRESITAEASKLKKAGVIRCSRGHIFVADREELERRACECYSVVRRKFKWASPWNAAPCRTMMQPACTAHPSSPRAAVSPGANGTRTNTGPELAQAPVTSADLATYLQQMRDQERADLARELHDELGSLLTGAKLEVATMKMHASDGSIDMLQRLQHLGEIINSGISFSRRVVEGLHPSSLTNLGLKASLEIMAREFQRSTGIGMAIRLEDVVLDEAAELTAYRLVQESLNNTSKYAGATDVHVVMLGCGSHAVLTVRDNGAGFDTAAKGPGGHGLAGMHHRVHGCGGQLTVSSARGFGTIVTAVLHARGAEQAPPQVCPPLPSLRAHSHRHQNSGTPQQRSACERRTGRAAPRPAAS